jgi:hypothetical protein
MENGSNNYTEGGSFNTKNKIFKQYMEYEGNGNHNNHNLAFSPEMGAIPQMNMQFDPSFFSGMGGTWLLLIYN